MKYAFAILSVLALAAQGTAALAQDIERRTPPMPQAIEPNPDAARSAARGGDWRASKLIGSSIRNVQDQSIGEIEDIILDSDGKVVSVLVSVGGFLGIGQKNVAVAYKELTISPAENGDPIVQISLSRQALETAPPVGGE